MTNLIGFEAFACVIGWESEFKSLERFDQVRDLWGGGPIEAGGVKGEEGEDRCVFRNMVGENDGV